MLWLEEALMAPHTWSYSASAATLLIECGRYPTPQLLQRWVNMHEVEINTRQVSVWTSQVLNEETDIEYRLEQDYLVEAVQTSILVEPEQFSQRWIEPIKAELLILIAKMGACKHLGCSFVQSLLIATSALDNMEKEARVYATIVASEPALNWDIERQCLHIFPLLYTPDDLPPPTEMVNLWDKGERGVKYAINKYYQHHWQNSQPQPLTYDICPSFFQTVVEKGVDTQELVLKRYISAMADILAWNTQQLFRKYSLRKLRVSSTPGDPQVTREDGAKAWRMTVILEGAGWRLHFWKLPTANGDAIEFANILKKHDPEVIFCAGHI